MQREVLSLVQDGFADFRRQVGRTRLGLLSVASHVCAGPRLIEQVLSGRRPASIVDHLQLPWLPIWPGLTAKPLHNHQSHPWTALLREASVDIRRELAAVRQSFHVARYESASRAKPWTVYYFYLEGRPIAEHLAACPRTAEVLRQIPHNGFHVCFSAIEPGGSLKPHTGPTNASLTAHLGLENCAGTRLWIADDSADYRDGEVLVFDDSFVHRVEHSGVHTRYTLMITFWHPELNTLERALLSRIVRMAPS